VTAAFKELDYRPTPLGTLSLCRRTLGEEVVYEIKLDDAYLMSSRFTVGEAELARLGLAACEARTPEVVVGGLGLGYTAAAVLEDGRVANLLVVDALDAVIDWHNSGLLPLGRVLTADRRCRLVHGDFFAMAGDGGFDPARPGRCFDAIIVDIDHSPRHLIDEASAGFYTAEGTRGIAARLYPRGVFALWSNDPPDDEYLGVLGAVFAAARGEVVTFDNPLQNRQATNTVYVAVKAG